MIKRTYDELVSASRPQLTLKTSTVYLKGVKIGDTIRVVRHDKKLDYDTRIFEITFNRLNNESSDIKLGDRISESNEAKIQNIASQKVDELVSSGFNNIISKLPEFLPSPEGFNNNWYGKDDPTKKYVGKVLVNDIWFKPNPEHEGQTILLRWTGEVWEEIIRSNTDQEIIDEISKRFENLNLSGVDEAKRKAEEALKKAGASEDLATEAKKIADKSLSNLNAVRDKTNNNEVKLAEYKQDTDGRITSLTSQVAGKINEADFQRVKETSQLYERVLGNTEQGLPDKISRLVMSNEIFQTEVNDLVVSDNNLIVNSEKLDKHTIVAKRNGVSIYNTDYGVFNIDAQGLTGYNWGGFTLPIYVPKILKGEVYTLGFKYKIRRQLDHEFCVVIKNHTKNKTVLQKTIANPETPVRNVWIDFQGTFKMTEDLDFDQQGNFPIFFYLVKNGWVEVKEPMLVRGPRTGSFKPSQFDEAYRNLEATKTQMTLLKDSWSVRNLNSAGDILGQMNLNPDGSIRINEGLISVGEKTYIKDGVIKKSMIGNAQIGTAHIGEIDASEARIINISAKNIVADGLTANIIKGGVLSALNGNSNFDLNAGRITMQHGPNDWKTSWDASGIAFRGGNNDVWGAMGGDAGGGVGIYMRGDHAFNLTVNHSDYGPNYSYTALRVKYGEGTTLQFSPRGPSYNLLLLFNDIYRNLEQLHRVKQNSTNYYWEMYGPLK